LQDAWLALDDDRLIPGKRIPIAFFFSHNTPKNELKEVIEEKAVYFNSDASVQE